MPTIALNLQKLPVLLVLISIYCGVSKSNANTSADSWFLFARTTNRMFDKCLKNNFDSMSMLWSCVKRNSLVLFDEITSADVIPITNSVHLFRDNDEIQSNLVDDSQEMSTYKYGKINRQMWIDHVLKRTIDILSTHKIRFDLANSELRDVGEGRVRHRFQVFPAMIFGMAVLGLITFPIGFHVLSLIGGKAFLFAVMALLISTMTSLKRLADYGTPYGISPPPYHHYHPAGYYERNDLK